MERNEILKEFEEAGAILKGHFILSSGLHSDTYLQCARIFMYAQRAEKLCETLAKKIHSEFGREAFDLIVSPAMGGVLVGYEMGRQLGLPAIFCERVDGEFSIRRGFTVERNARILIVEDVVTTGKSSLEAVECAKEAGGKVVAEACLVNRNGQSNPFPHIPLVSLIDLEVNSFSEDNIPEQLASIPAIKPGSRWIK